jgi:hypothetical protein
MEFAHRYADAAAVALVSVNAHPRSGRHGAQKFMQSFDKATQQILGSSTHTAGNRCRARIPGTLLSWPWLCFYLTVNRKIEIKNYF